MDLFISWSGASSKKIAEAIREWIPCVIQAVQPYYTPDDISKGDRWSGEIAKKLESSQLGLIILTPDNLEAPWLMFEAGALSKNIGTSSVCPLLFGVSPADIKGPLLQFQCSLFSKQDMRKLLETINDKLEGYKLDDKTLSSTFDVWWEKLEEKITSILEDVGKSISSPSKVRPDRDILEEVLRLVRKSTYNHAWDKTEEQFNLLKDTKPVTFDPDTGVISFWQNQREIYDFSIDRLSSGSEVLDWILQVNLKSWCSPQHLKSFVTCLEEVSDLYFNTNAQGVFCPMGSNKTVDWEMALTNKGSGR